MFENLGLEIGLLEVKIGLFSGIVDGNIAEYHSWGLLKNHFFVRVGKGVFWRFWR